MPRLWDDCAESVTGSTSTDYVERGGSTPTSALQLRVEEISVDLAMELNASWHSVLPETYKGNLLRNKRSIFYGAKFAEKFWAVALWTTPVAANRLIGGDDLLELRRFAIAPNRPKNTASRLLAVMTRLLQKKFPEVIGLISYQAIDHHSGTIYKAAGWIRGSRQGFTVWKDRPDSKRRKAQTQSDKIRWEKRLRDDHFFALLNTVGNKGRNTKAEIKQELGRIKKRKK